MIQWHRDMWIWSAKDLLEDDLIVAHETFVRPYNFIMEKLIAVPDSKQKTETDVTL